MNSDEIENKSKLNNSFKNLILKSLLITFVLIGIFLIYTQDKNARESLTSELSIINEKFSIIQSKLHDYENKIKENENISSENIVQENINNKVFDYKTHDNNLLFEEAYKLVNSIQYAAEGKSQLIENNSQSSNYSNKYLQEIDNYLHKVFSVKPLKENVDKKIKLDLEKNELKFSILKMQLYYNVGDVSNYTSSKKLFEEKLANYGYDQRYIEALKFILSKVGTI
jgi:hypothetical protein